MYPSKWKLEMEERVEKRWFLWHEKNNFTWTNENVQKIFCLNHCTNYIKCTKLHTIMRRKCTVQTCQTDAFGL